MVKSLHSPGYEQFRLLLTKARESAGLTQSEVSSRLGRPQSFVAKYEGGERRLDVVELIEVCSVLGVDAAQLVARLQQERSR